MQHIDEIGIGLKEEADGVRIWLNFLISSEWHVYRLGIPKAQELHQRLGEAVEAAKKYKEIGEI